MAEQGIDGLGPLPDQKFPNAKHHGRILCLLALHRNEAHRRARRCFANRLGIGRIDFLTLHEGFHVGRRDEPNVMAELPNLATSEVRTATGFHRDDAGWQLTEKSRTRSANYFAIFKAIIQPCRKMAA